MVAILSPVTVLLRRFRYAQQLSRCEVPIETDWETHLGGSFDMTLMTSLKAKGPALTTYWSAS
jgi:hypothetical protein